MPNKIILLVKPGAINGADAAALSNAGYLPIESDDPEALSFPVSSFEEVFRREVGEEAVAIIRRSQSDYCRNELTKLVLAKFGME